MKRQLLEDIKKDRALTPFFIDYIGDNLKMSMAGFYGIENTLALKYRANASKSLVLLSKKLEDRIDQENLYSTIEAVCDHYLQFVALTGGNFFKIDDE